MMWDVNPGTLVILRRSGGLPVIGTNSHDSIESWMYRTKPSRIRTLSPPGCMSEAEFVQAVIAVKAILLQAFVA